MVLLGRISLSQRVVTNCCSVQIKVFLLVHKVASVICWSHILMYYSNQFWWMMDAFTASLRTY